MLWIKRQYGLIWFGLLWRIINDSKCWWMEMACTNISNEYLVIFVLRRRRKNIGFLRLGFFIDKSWARNSIYNSKWLIRSNYDKSKLTQCRINVNFSCLSLPIILCDSHRKYKCICYFGLVHRSFWDGLKDKIYMQKHARWIIRTLSNVIVITDEINIDTTYIPQYWLYACIWHFNLQHMLYHRIASHSF